MLSKVKKDAVVKKKKRHYFNVLYPGGLTFL